MSRIIQELAVKEGLGNGLLSPGLPSIVSVKVQVVHHDETRPSSQAELESKAVNLTKPVKVKAKVKTKKPQEDERSGSEETDKTSRRTRRRNGFTPLTESEKRVKQRMLVKRSYYRKIVRFFGSILNCKG